MSGRTLLCLCSFVCGVRVLQWTCVHASLVPRPHPDFCCLQYGKAGEAWYLFSWCNQKMTKICRTSRLHLRVFSTDYTLNAQCVIPSSPTSYIHVVSYNVPGTLALSLFWAQCTHAQFKPFYHLFYPDVTHVRNDTRALSHFSILQATESWAGPGNEAVCMHGLIIYGFYYVISIFLAIMVQ